MDSETITLKTIFGLGGTKTMKYFLNVLYKKAQMTAFQFPMIST